MIVSINQPAYLPWLGYFERIERSDMHIVLDHVQFEKNSFINRNKIRSKNGVAWLTVPVSTKGQFGNLAICNLEIAGPITWRRKHWESIRMGYSRAPFFDNYKEPYQQIYSQEWSEFMPFLRALLKQHVLDLGIKTPLIFSSNMVISGQKTDLILNICKSVGATTYLSGLHGQNYIDDKAFIDKGIAVVYQDYRHPVYAQAWPGFESHLNFLDLLFNHGMDSLKIIMANHLPGAAPF